jgi:hypothetical protein
MDPVKEWAALTFNIATIEGDTANTTYTRLKKISF